MDDLTNSPSSPATSGSGEEGDTEIRSIITHLLNSDEDDTPHSYLIDQGARFDRLTDQWWDRCQRFYRLSSTQGKDPADCISINGLRRSISPHQAFAAYYMLSQEKRSGGGYLADEMGLGKTTTAILVCFLSHLLSRTWREVENEWKSGHQQHHLPEENDKNYATDCPSFHHRPICCPCVRRGPSSMIRPIPLPTLVVVPKRLLGTWQEEWVKTISGDGSNRMRLVVGHNDSRNNQNVESYEQWWRGQNQDQGYGSLVSPWARPHARWRAAVDLLRRENPQLHPTKATEKLNQSRQCDYHSWRTLQQEPTKPELYRKCPLTDNLVVLTNPNSYQRLVAKLLEVEENSPTQIPGRRVKGYARVSGAHWGRLIRDEAHQERNPAGITLTVALIRGLEPRPRLWMLTGTPFEVGPADIQCYHELLARPLWQMNPATREREIKELQGFDARFKTAICRRESTARVTQDFQSWLTRCAFIRRTVNTQWFGQTVVALPPREERTEYVNRSTLYQMAQSALTAPGTHLDGGSRLHRLRIFADFPYLDQLIKDHPSRPPPLTRVEMDSLTETECRKWFYPHIPQIMRTSPKFVWLRRLIQGAQVGRHEQMTSTQRRDGKATKYLILTNFPIIAFLVHMGLEKYTPALHPKLISASTNEAEMALTLQIFQQYETGDTVYGEDGSCYAASGVLVSTTKILGVGITCTRATHAILMEPALLETSEEQAFGRIWRMGQTEETVCWRLRLQGAEVEKAICDRHASRRDLRSGGNQPQDPLGIIDVDNPPDLEEYYC